MDIWGLVDENNLGLLILVSTKSTMHNIIGSAYRGCGFDEIISASVCPHIERVNSGSGNAE